MLEGLCPPVLSQCLEPGADTGLRLDGHPNCIDPDKWRPLIASFCRFYGLGKNLHPSRLAQGPEEACAPWRTRANPERQDPGEA